MTFGAILARLAEREPGDPVRIDWVGEGSAVVTTGELQTAIVLHRIDPAEIQALQFVTTLP